MSTQYDVFEERTGTSFSSDIGRVWVAHAKNEGLGLGSANSPIIRFYNKAKLIKEILSSEIVHRVDCTHSGCQQFSNISWDARDSILHLLTLDGVHYKFKSDGTPLGRVFGSIDGVVMQSRMGELRSSHEKSKARAFGFNGIQDGQLVLNSFPGSYAPPGGYLGKGEYVFDRTQTTRDVVYIVKGYYDAKIKSLKVPENNQPPIIILPTIIHFSIKDRDYLLIGMTDHYFENGKTISKTHILALANYQQKNSDSHTRLWYKSRWQSLDNSFVNVKENKGDKVGLKNYVEGWFALPDTKTKYILRPDGVYNFKGLMGAQLNLDHADEESIHLLLRGLGISNVELKELTSKY